MELRRAVSAICQDAPRVRFLSIEPLIGPVGTIDLTGIDWVIVGGKVAPALAMKRERVSEVRDQCRDSKVAFFFKQWGGLRPKSAGRKLDGRNGVNFPRPGQQFQWPQSDSFPL
jgi:protein gp37